MKKIAIITGASSGIGKEFAMTLSRNIAVDELWVIARNKSALEDLRKEIKLPIKTLALDLTDEKSFKLLKEELANEKIKINIKLLINASGYGKFEKTTNISEEDCLGMIRLNCAAVTMMCLTCIPYMEKDSKIINIASAAAFQPVPYINVYASTKSYVLSFSRGLNQELKKDGISVMAVCPYWTKTKFFDRAVEKNVIVKKYNAMYEPSAVINKAWKDLASGKDVSKYGFVSRFQIGLCKILPHSVIMKIWLKQQKLD